MAKNINNDSDSPVVGGSTFGEAIRDESIDVNKLAFLLNDDDEDDEEDITTQNDVDEAKTEAVEEKMPSKNKSSKNKKEKEMKEQDDSEEETIKPVRNFKNRDSVKSPLDQMKENKKEKGMKVSNEELEAHKEKTEYEDMVTATHRDTFDKALEDADMSLEKRKRVVLIKAIDSTNRSNVAKAMDEIESVVINEDGTAEIDYRDVHGNPAKPEYIRLRTEKDPTWEEEQELIKKMKEEEKTQNPEVKERYNETIDDVREYRKKRQVQVIIDKTGIGGKVDFTDEEKAKLKEADEILLKSIKVVDIKSSSIKRAVKSFSANNAAYEIYTAAMPVPFPASGFRGQMKPLSYGELGEISNTMSDILEYDKMRKRYSMIYDKLTNISTGPFKTFNEFLNHFAFTDLEIAIFGLLVSTFSEESYAVMRCTNLAVCYDTEINRETGKREKVPRQYEFKYNPRSIFRLDRCHEDFVAQASAVLQASDEEAKKIYASSPVNNSTLIELPGSRYIVEFGIGSAQHFLDIIPALQQAYIDDRYGDRPDKVNNPIMLPYVLSIRVPETDPLGEPTGEYLMYQNYDDILDIFEVIPLNDMRIITSFVATLTEVYAPVFEFEKAKCPYCGQESRDITVTPSILVFQNYSRQINTTMNVSDALDTSTNAFRFLRGN